MRFAILTVTGKNRAVDLLLELSRIRMGDYHLMKNNCRDFVAAAMDIISENKMKYDDDALAGLYVSQNERNRNKEDVQRVKDEDTENVVAAGLLTGLAFVGVFKLGHEIYKAVKSDDQDRHHQ